MTDLYEELGGAAPSPAAKPAGAGVDLYAELGGSGEDSWADVGAKTIERAGHLLNAQVGGIEQAATVASNAPAEFAANTLKGINRLAATGLAYVAPGSAARGRVAGGDPLVRAAGNITPSTFAPESVERIKADPTFQRGADRFAYHTGRAQELQPNVDQWSAKGIAGAAGEAILTSVLPAMAAGTVGGVVAGLTPMTAQVYGQKLGEMVKAGKPLAEAQDAAGFAVLSEVVPEVVPLSYALKAGIPFWKRIFGASWREGLQEQVTELLQVEWDKNKGQDISLKEALNRIAYSGVVGMVPGATMGALGSGGKAPQQPPRTTPAEIPANVEDVLGGEPGGIGQRALPAPPKVARIIVDPSGVGTRVDSRGEVIPASTPLTDENVTKESQAADLYREDLGQAEVAGAVQGRAPLPDVGQGELLPAEREPADLLKTIAAAGGLSREAAQSEGIDPANFGEQKYRTMVFGRPLFPKAGGMTMDGLAEFLSQRGYLPEGQYSANEALDLVDRALRGEKIYAQEDAAGAAERAGRQHEADQREQFAGKPGETGVEYRAAELRSRMADVGRARVKGALGAEAAQEWQPKPDDFALSGYNREAEDVQDIAETVFDGARVMGDQWEPFYERFLIQNQDLEGDAFESTLRAAIRSHEDAEKPGVPSEARPRLQGRDEPAQAGEGPPQARQVAPEARPAGQEVTPPQPAAAAAPVQPAASSSPQLGEWQKGPDSEGQSIRTDIVKDSGATGRGTIAVAIDKKNDQTGSRSTFYVKRDGGIIDSDQISLMSGDAAGRDSIWQARTEVDAEAVAKLVQERNTHALGSKENSELKKRVADLVKKLGDRRDGPADLAGPVDKNKQAVEVTPAPAAPVAAPAPAAELQAERRTDTAGRKRVADMSVDEARAALLTDPLTGLPNRRAYDEAEKKAVQAAIDLDGLKWINDNMGHESGDMMLTEIGHALRDSGLDAYHISGDEFMAQGDDQAALERGLEAVRMRLDNARITVEGADGKTITKTGVHFSYGIGSTRNEADQALGADKANREAAGLRNARGEAPRGVERAEGQPDRPDTGAAAQEVKPAVAEQKPTESPQADLFAPMVEAAKAMTKAAEALTTAVEANKAEKPVELPATSPARKSDIQDTQGSQSVVKSDAGSAKLLADGAQRPSGVKQTDGAINVPGDRPKGSAINSSVAKSGPDDVVTDAKTIGDLPDTDTLVEHGYGALEVPSQSRVFKAVLSFIHDDKVFRSVVTSIPVDVMNNLVGSKFSAKDAFNDKSVLIHALTTNTDLAVRGAAIDAIVSSPAITVAEIPLVDLGGAAKDSLSASQTIDRNSHEAATSAASSEPMPTEAQIEAGNYRHGHINIAGLDISVENPEGSIRAGKDGNGKPWTIKMQSTYGYFKRSEGKDGDQVDVFIKPGTPEDYSGPVFVVDQTNKDGAFDEHKTLIGWPDEAAARAGYLENYTKGWTGLGAIKQYTLPEFKMWLKAGNTKKPVAFGYAEPKPSQTPAVVQSKAKAEKPASKTFDDYLAEREARAKSFGRSKIIEETQNALAGMTLGREFGESMEAFYARRPDLKTKTDAYQAFLKGEKAAPAIATDPRREVARQWREIGNKVDQNLPILGSLGRPTDADFKEAAEKIGASITDARRAWNILKNDIEVPVSAPSEKKAAKAEVVPGKIDDVGEKVGGARKDIAESTGPRMTREKSEVPGWRKRYEVAEIASSMVPGEKGRWVIHDTRKEDFRGRNAQVGERKGYATQEEAEAAIPLVAVSRNHRVSLTRDGKHEIVREVSDRKRVKVVDQQFDTREDALRYMAQHAAEIIETKTSFGEEILPIPDHVVREGPERRTGNVTGEDFRDTYGFRAVEFGLWNNQEERQQVMNHAYDALADLAEILNIPAESIGLNGELALAFGARGHGLVGARAHYEGDYGIINLTKMSGAGSLAHEWLHSLDHYFARQDTKAKSEKVLNQRGDKVYPDQNTDTTFASYGFKREGSGVRPELRDAYKAVIDTMFNKAEKFVEDTQKADKFVAEVRADVEKALAAIRKDLAMQKDVTYWKRNNKPASAEQLAEFDAVAEKIVNGEMLETAYKPTDSKTRRNLMSGRWTNDALEKISAINKAVRGRSGFGSAQSRGILDSLRDDMRRYSMRLKMLADAQSGEEKTKKVPTSYAMEARSIDQGRASEYWTTPHEMAARAFQAYVEDKIAEKGGRSDFLIYGTNQAVPTPWGWKRPFPAGEERKAINAAFDKLVSELKTKETDQGTALFSRSGEKSPSLITDNPGGEWLERKRQETIEEGRNEFGNYRRFGTVTGSYSGPVSVPMSVLSGIKGMRGEQGKVRKSDLAEIKKIMSNTGKLPLGPSGSEYRPFIMVGQDGVPWVNEGNHRIMAAAELGWETMLVEVRYFNGGETAPGPLSPDKIKKYQEPQFSRAQNEPTFYSQLARAIESAKQAAMPAKQWALWLKANAAKLGVKQDEIDAVGLNEWLDLQTENADGFVRELIDDGRMLSPAQKKKIAVNPGMVSNVITKEQVLDFVRQNGVQVKEVTLGEEGSRSKWTAEQKERADIDDRYAADEYRTYIVKDQNGNVVDNVLAKDPEHAIRMADSTERNYTKFESYQLPGGENYRELLLTLPTDNRGANASEIDKINSRLVDKGYDGLYEEQRQAMQRGGNEAIDLLDDLDSRVGIRTDDIRNSMSSGDSSKQFRSSHFDEPNILAHVRFNERADADGKKVLFIEEVQSDWAQAGRKKGFDKNAEITSWVVANQNGGVAAGPYVDRASAEFGLRSVQRENPNTHFTVETRTDRSGRFTPSAPFVTKTEAWTLLAMKRMIRYAAENGFDRLAWTTGTQQAARYDLSKQVRQIVVTPRTDAVTGERTRSVALDLVGSSVIRFGVNKDGVIDNTNSAQGFGDANGKPLSEVIGKELAERVMQSERATFEGDDLKVGGEGMRAFYDQMLPQMVNKYVKKFGANVSEVKILGEGPGITPTYLVIEKDGHSIYSAESARWKAEKKAEEIGGTVREERSEFTQPGIDITPAMRESVMQGQPLFAVDATKGAGNGISLPDGIDAELKEKAAALEAAGQSAGPFKITAGRMLDAVLEGATGQAQDDLRAVKVLQDLFGAPVALLTSDGKFKFNGVYYQNMIWLDANTSMSLPLVFGHELSHRMEADNPAAYRALLRAVTPMLRNMDAYEQKNRLEGFSDAYIAKEMLGDVLGDRFGEPEFWNQVAAHTTRSEFQKIVEAIRMWIDTVIAKMRGLGKPIGLGSSQFVTDLEAARKVLAKAVADYADARRAGEQQGDALFSRKTGEAAEPSVKGVAPGLLTAYRDRARKVIDRIDRALEPLGTLPDRKEYLTKRYLTLGKIAKGDDIAKAVGKAFANTTAADKQAVFDYLTTKAASPKSVQNDLARADAVRAKNLIESVSDAMVARGMLSAEAREAHRGSYLPQLYLKWLLNDADVKALGAGKKPSDMGYLKGRKIERTKGPDGEMRLAWRETGKPLSEAQVLDLGPITDPGFLAATAIAKPVRDMALLDFLEQISQNEKWILENNLVDFEGTRSTPQFLKVEADRLRRQADHYSPEDAKTARSMADRMDAAANKALGALAGDFKNYREVPNTAKYGRLRGLWVRKEIYDDLVGAYNLSPEDPGFVQSLLGYGGIGTKATQLWKMGKVSLNPPAQIRNFVSNGVLLQLSGVPLHKVPVYLTKAVREVSGNGPAWKIAKKYGVTESTFATQELYRIKRDLLDLEMREGKLNPIGKLHRIGAIIADGASDAYQFSEALYKTAKIMHAMDNGASEAEAAIEAQKWLFDYSLVPKNVRIARNIPTGMPFITFQYKILPRLAEVAVLHPQRLLPWVALFAGWPLLWAMMAGEDDDEYERLQKAMPKWLQERGHAMILPYTDDEGRSQVLDLGYFMPWSMYTDAIGDLSRGEIGDTAQTLGIFSGPVTSVIVAMKTGKDPFTGRDIMDPGDPPGRQFAAATNYAWDMMMPPIVSSRGLLSPMGLVDQEYGGKLVSAATGRTNKFGDPTATGTQAALYPFGLNVYSIEPKHATAQNVLRLKYEADQTEQTVKRKLQNRALSDEARREIVQEYTDELKRRYEKIEEYKKQ